MRHRGRQHLLRVAPERQLRLNRVLTAVSSGEIAVGIAGQGCRLMSSVLGIGVQDRDLLGVSSGSSSAGGSARGARGSRRRPRGNDRDFSPPRRRDLVRLAGSLLKVAAGLAASWVRRAEREIGRNQTREGLSKPEGCTADFFLHAAGTYRRREAIARTVAPPDCVCRRRFRGRGLHRSAKPIARPRSRSAVEEPTNALDRRNRQDLATSRRGEKSHVAQSIFRKDSNFVRKSL